MGLLSSIFGAETEQEPTVEAEEKKYAIVLNAGPDEVAVAGNAFNYAVEFDEKDYEVQVFLDGEATKLPGAYADNPDKPFNYDWEKINERGLLAGACGYCANAMGEAEACERTDVPLLSDSDAHAPSVGSLAEQDYQILTVG